MIERIVRKSIYLSNNESITIYIKNTDGTFQPIEINVDTEYNKEVNYGIDVSGHCLLGMSTRISV